jgi:hypothetical protein
MKTIEIIKDLKERKKALTEQANQLPDYANDEDELIWATILEAKLELIEDLLLLYTK